MSRTWVVVDLEATCWSADEDPALAAQQRTEAEVIEIGAVRVDPMAEHLPGEFQTFVRPTRHPALSGFCRELTGIQQADVDDAPTFSVAYERLLLWMGGAEGAVLASWGGFDHNQLCRQAVAAGHPRPTWVAHNIKAAFADWYRAHTGRRARHGLGRAVRELGWAFEGTAHRGIDDARNAARLLLHLRDPENASPHAKRLLGWVIGRAPAPTSLYDARQEWPDAKVWWHAAKQELQALEVVEELPNGRGLLPTTTLPSIPQA